MKFFTTFNKLLNVDDISAEQQNSRENFLVREGNQVHKALIYIQAFYGFTFIFITWYLGYYYQMALNAALFAFSCLAYLIQYKGYAFYSKLFNLSQIILIIGLMYYYPASNYGIHINDSVLVFYIPVSVGTLIAFQGKENKYGYILSGIILLVALFLIITDTHYLPEHQAPVLSDVSYDLLFNIIGAAVATFVEVAYILALNNRLNESLSKANHELDNFVYIVSHDLRSPLMLTKGLLDISKLKVGEKEEVLKYLDLAGKSINNLDDIIKEILAYSRNSRTGLQNEEFDLKAIIKDIKDGLEIKEGPLFSFVEEFNGDTRIYADKGRLHTILRNLITNAVKYRKKESPGAFVKLVFTKTINRFTITVSDNGQGIAQESMDKVFDMFYRATSVAPGTGLGLYICKEMLEKMGADFNIESVEGQGTRFTFSLEQAPQLVSA
jgi:signal transduction histidine kinase